MKEKINSLELSSNLILCIVYASIGLTLFTTIRIAGIDSYIGVFIGAILGIIPLLFFLYILNYETSLPLYEKNIHIFGKYFGTVINYLMIFIYIIIAITALFNLSNFIVSQYLAETPLLIVMAAIMIITFYASNKGIEVISRTSSIFLIIVLFLFLFEFAYLYKEINLDNLKPILLHGISSPIKAGYINALITLSPIYTLLIIPKDNIVDKLKVNRRIIISYVIAILIIFGVSFFACSILGEYLITLYQYPGFIILKKISIFDFIDRIENFLSLHWILSCFINLTIILYFISNSVYRKNNNKYVNLLISIVILFLSYKLFINNTTFNNYTYKIYPYILMILFGIIVIITVGIFIKRILGKKKKAYI